MIEHRNLTPQEAEALTGQYVQNDVVCLYGVFHTGVCIAIYGVLTTNEVSLHIFPNSLSRLQVWREIKKGLHLLNALGYVNIWADGQHKYLQKLGFVQDNGKFIYRSSQNG